MRKTDQMTLAVNAALTVEEYGREALEAGTVAYAGDGALVYEPGDSGVYDLTTESGVFRQEDLSKKSIGN